MAVRLDLMIILKSMSCLLLPVRPFLLRFILIVLTPSRRNGWGGSASRGWQYPVSFLNGLRFSWLLHSFV